MSKRLKRLMRQGRYAVTFDHDFEGVIKACAGKREGHWPLTWITPRIMHAYATLYDAGYAHSFEVWNEEGALVGGGYGVAIGRAFFTESQFSLEPNTSKLGFAVLNWHLARWGYRLNDGKWATPTIIDRGFRMVPRPEFFDLLAASWGGAASRGDGLLRLLLRSLLAGMGNDWEPPHPRNFRAISGSRAKFALSKVL
jgi:leucyl/phenylalanyl-tRNA--protein transferase